MGRVRNTSLYLDSRPDERNVRAGTGSMHTRYDLYGNLVLPWGDGFLTSESRRCGRDTNVPPEHATIGDDRRGNHTALSAGASVVWSPGRTSCWDAVNTPRTFAVSCPWVTARWGWPRVPAAKRTSPRSSTAATPAQPTLPQGQCQIPWARDDGELRTSPGIWERLPGERVWTSGRRSQNMRTRTTGLAVQ